MKTKTPLPLVLLLTFILGAGIFSACRKKEKTPDEPEPIDSEQATITDNNIAENFVLDIDAMGSELSENSSAFANKSSSEAEAAGEKGLTAAPCATLSGLGTQVITVDFGTTGCTGADGRTRTGRLIYNFSASSPSTAVFYRNPGFSMSVSSQSYVVDGYSVSIVNKNVTNTTPGTLPPTINPGTNLTWAITASVTIAKPNAAGTISWFCTRTKELINTSDTNCYRGQSRAIKWNKAIVRLNGSAGGVNARSENYTAVASNLVRDFNCSPDPLRPGRHPFIGGAITYTPGTRPVRVINYGNGTSCDLNATLLVNGNTYNIVLN